MSIDVAATTRKVLSGVSRYGLNQAAMEIISIAMVILGIILLALGGMLSIGLRQI